MQSCGGSKFNSSLAAGTRGSNQIYKLLKVLMMEKMWEKRTHNDLLTVTSGIDYLMYYDLLS